MTEQKPSTPGLQTASGVSLHESLGASKPGLAEAAPKVDAEPPASRSTSSPPPSGDAPSTQAIDILLVEDEPRNLDVLEAVLACEEYRLLRAVDANTALQLLLEHNVAAIVLDINMPQVNGIELAGIIKGTKRFRQVPILFLTAYLDADADIIRGYGAGAADYVTKPFNPAVLRHKVGVYAELFRKTRALAELNEQLEQRVQARTAELEESERALKAAARQKDEFIATLAHELRNPLVPLRTGLDLLTQIPIASATPTAVAAPQMAKQSAVLER